MWLGLAFLSVSQARKGWWPFTVFLGLPEARPNPRAVACDLFLWSGHSLFHSGRGLGSTNWLSDLGRAPGPYCDSVSQPVQ